MKNRIDLLRQQIEVAILEARQSQQRADHFGLRITTRAYLDRQTTDGAGRLLTPRELEQDELQTQATHINLAEVHLDRAKRLLRDQKELIEEQLRAPT